MKAKLFINGAFIAALYLNPQLGGLSVAMFRRSDWQNVANRFLGSVCDAVRFLRVFDFSPVSDQSELLLS